MVNCLTSHSVFLSALFLAENTFLQKGERKLPRPLINEGLYYERFCVQQTAYDQMPPSQTFNAYLRMRTNEVLLFWIIDSYSTGPRIFQSL